MPLSTYSANAFLNWLGNASNMPSAPATVYVALYNGNPGDAGSGGTDVTTTIRAGGRVAISFGSPSGKEIVNDADVDFGLAAAPADVTHYGVWDASTSGNLLYYAALTAARSFAAGDPAKFPVSTTGLNLAS